MSDGRNVVRADRDVRALVCLHGVFSISVAAFSAFQAHFQWRIIESRKVVLS